MQDDDAREDFLWDGSGAPDADVERLARVLRPLGAREDAVPPPARSPEPVAASAVRVVRSPRALRSVAVAAGILAAATVLTLGVMASMRGPTVYRFEPGTRGTASHGSSAGNPPAVATAPAPTIRDRAAPAGAPFAAGSWVATADAPRELLIGDLGRVTLAAQSRLQIRHVADETTRLYLEKGSLEAFVSAAARPRFFQVDTDAARCVDLGCRYTLSVDAAGVATVRVTTGQVAFEAPGREVFVPAGAMCEARPQFGPGTPRFEDARPLVCEAFDAFDVFDSAAEAPPERRRALAQAALDSVRGARDTLSAWHLLQDRDPEIARAAEARLRLVAGACDVPSDGTPAGDRAAWREYLRARCW